METAVVHEVELDKIARELGLPPHRVARTLELLDEGNTVPFITRYRKDQTGGLDEEQIRAVQDRVARARLLAERRQTILKSIESQGKLTPEIEAAIRAADSVKLLEDLYLPFKPKKQTFATLAKQRGLSPLAREILEADPEALDLEDRARLFVNAEKQLPGIADVLLGVGHLLAEHFSEQAELRGRLRDIFLESGRLTCTRVEESSDNAGKEGADDEAESASAETAADERTSSEGIADEVASGVEPIDAGTSTGVVPVAESASEEIALTDGGEQPRAEEVAPFVPVDGETEIDDSREGEPESAAKGSPVQDPTTNEPVVEESVEQSVFAATAEKEGEIVFGPPEAPQPPQTTKPLAAPGPRESAAVQEREQRRHERRERKNAEREKKRKRLEAQYKDYFQFDDSLGQIPPHRVLAINRGERLRVLRVKLHYDADAMHAAAEAMCLPQEHPHFEFLRGCLRDSLVRLIFPSLEREARRELTERAENHAVEVFIRNLRKLLLQPPVRGRRVLAIDPGFKSGCKLAVLDEFGNLLDRGVIHIVGKEERLRQGRDKLAQLVRDHQVNVVAIGNGTACRQTEKLVAELIAGELAGRDLVYVIVNEAGASVYSTSTLGREELPQLDATLRSAVSIGRRLLDPLSELVKIDPASIGVGLYQHDVKARHLRESLDAVVESCVNFVGVDVNTASPALLRYVSGLNQLTARRLYEYRQTHGPFRSREEFREVPGFGEATFIQAAGFLKINGGENPLDATSIHPESYEVARQLLERVDSDLGELADQLPVHEVPAEPSVGPSTEAPIEPLPEPTTETPSAVEAPLAAASPSEPTEPQSAAAMLAEGGGPAAEPSRGQGTHSVAAVESIEETSSQGPPSIGTEHYPEPSLPPTGETPSPVPEGEAEPAGLTTPQLEAAMIAEGGPVVAPSPARSGPPLAERMKQLDIEQLSEEFGVGRLMLEDLLDDLVRPGRDPREDLPPPIFRREVVKLEDLEPGMELTGNVLNVVDFGAFVDIGLSDSGLVHISRLADRFIRDPHEVVSVGDILRVWVVEVDKQRRRVSLTAIQPGTERPRGAQGHGGRGEGGSEGARRPPRGRRRSARGGGQQGAPQGGGQASGGQPGDGSRGRGRESRPPGGQRGRGRGAKMSGPPPRRQPPKPITPITPEMEEGAAPMRTFSDLAQFFAKKKKPGEPQGGEGQES